MNVIVSAWCLAFAFGGSMGVFARVVRNHIAGETDLGKGGE